ncbi:MAG: hypothetical protein J6333_02595, partial [Planctomycetes bacterium]|nr:hypothetical protein [Planctomycetota bacterium]
MSSSDKKMGKDEITRALDSSLMDEMIPEGPDAQGAKADDLTGLERAVAQDPGDAPTTSADADIDALLSAEAGKGAAEVSDIDSILANAGGTDPNEAMGQNDIDALIANALPGDASAQPAGDATNVGQNEIDALLAEASGGAPADATNVGQNEIDALLAANGAAPAGDEGSMGQGDIDALLKAAQNGEASAAAPAGDEGSMGQGDIDALLKAAQNDEAAA